MTYKKWKTPTKMAKVDPLFLNMVKEVEKERYYNNLDKKPVGTREITKRMTRYKPLWDVLKIAEFKKDNTGQFNTQFNIFTIIVVSFVAVVLFAGLVWIMGLLNSTFHEVGLNNEINSGNPGYVNLTEASDLTFGNVNSSIQSLRLVALTLIFSLIIGTMISNALIQKIHPVFFFAYILIILLAVIFSAQVSNSYETLVNSDIFDGSLQTFTGSSWILLNLPVVIALTGILGGVFLFINMIRTGNEGVTLS